MAKHDLAREINELKNQLSYSKNIGFFLGAGSSCALGIPNIAQLTTEVEGSLKGELSKGFKCLKEDLESTFPDKTINIEDILNHIRRIRDITGERGDKKYLDVNGEAAKKLDNEICKQIYTIISEKELEANLGNTKKLFAWLSMQNRDFSKEVFTTNYDLIIEKSLEEIQVPYFDGFIGSYEPFFWQESIDKFVEHTDLTHNWIRLWKIHGSLGWFWKKNTDTDSHKIIRVGKVDDITKEDNELVIYPSKEKYDSSRKQPFIAYFDRLKNYLLKGEHLFIFSGYSFSDQHINEIIFNCLRQNKRLCVLVFFYQDEEVETLYKLSASYLNLSAFGPKKALINGNIGEWDFNKDDCLWHQTFWDESKETLTLGDFNNLATFLVASSGKKETIESMIDDK